MPSSMQRPGCAHNQVDRFVQVFWLARVFQVFKGREPFIRAWLWQTAIVGSNNAMHTAALFRLEMGQREMAHLRVDSIDAPIKLNKGRTHQFITRRAPVLCQLRWNIRAAW